MFWATGVLIFETCRYVERRKNKYLSVKQILVLVIIALIFVWGFGAIGDFRTHSIFGGGASKYYHTPADWPSGITWIYIYLSSPFENARYALSSISVRNYSYFNLLFYPIIKLLSNIIGMGSKYSQYVEHFDNVYPILKSGYGLNVGSFMLDAYADLNIIGILVYICMYDVIAFFIHKLMNSRKTLGISKSIMFPIIIQIAIWSVFSNSVFKIAGIWVDIFFVLIWDKCSKLKIRLGRA